MIFLPLEREAYVGIPGTGATRYRYSEEGLWTAVSIEARGLATNTDPVVLASRRHSGPRLQRCLSWLEAEAGGYERDNSGSALKFCQLAAGRGDFYPRFSPCSEWDVAAGQALVEAAGGAVLGLDGKPLRYNARDTLLSPSFLAFADPAASLWSRLPADLFA